MNKSEQINDLIAALAKAQGEMGHAGKDAANPHFRSKFASLASVIDAVRVPFAKNGLAFFHSVSAEGSTVKVACTIAHSSGQWISSEFSAQAQDAKPQSIGSCISYGKRYGLQALAGIASADEDDDGEQAHGRQQQRQTPAPINPLAEAFAAATKKGKTKAELLTLATEACGYAVTGAADIKPEDVAKVIAKWGVG